MMSKRINKSASQHDAIIVRQPLPLHEQNAAIADELLLVEALRKGDERAFTSLIDMYHPAMLRLAMIYVSKQTIAEEVVQETWVSILQSLPRFEGRSSLKTWIFHILVNRAKTFALREGRSVPFSSLANSEIDSDEPTVDPDRFFPPDSPKSGAWISLPENWDTIPEQRLLSQETYQHVNEAIASLAPSQRTVIILHDIEGWTPQEIRTILDISETNQRVLLHRARAKVRRALERYFNEKEEV